MRLEQAYFPESEMMVVVVVVMMMMMMPFVWTLFNLMNK
jgi:hypothetical protein